MSRSSPFVSRCMTLTELNWHGVPAVTPHRMLTWAAQNRTTGCGEGWRTR